MLLQEVTAPASWVMELLRKRGALTLLSIPPPARRDGPARDAPARSEHDMVYAIAQIPAAMQETALQGQRLVRAGT